MLPIDDRKCIACSHFPYVGSCIHNVVVGFVAVCEPNYSHLLAYSFLDELSKEFNTLYTASVVAAVRRPYAFIEFGEPSNRKIRTCKKKKISALISANCSISTSSAWK